MTDYFSLDELRTLPDLTDTTVYPDAVLTRARAWITAIIERVCETSFVPVAKTETLSGQGSSRPFLLKDYVLSLTSVTVAGADVTAQADATAGGLLTWYGNSGGSCASAWPLGLRNIVVSYSAGYSSTPPADLKEAAMQAARYRVVSVDGASGVPSRALSITNEFGNVSLASASMDRPTGIPDVDAAILGWAMRVRSPRVG